MAKFVHISTRNPDDPTFLKFFSYGKLIEKKLFPSDLNLNEQLDITDKCSSSIIFNPTGVEKVKKNSICLGLLYEKSSRWNEIGCSAPDGNYCIIRSEPNVVELLSDYQATNSIWYYYDQKIFLASNSQRAIITILGDYKPNRETILWMLSSGTLGPYLSWDKRLKSMGAGVILNLELAEWKLTLTQSPIKFEAVEKPPSEHAKSYAKSVKDVVSSFPKGIDYAFQLTGGYDSRLLLNISRQIGKYFKKYFTMGLDEAKSIKYSDADIASRLASKYKLNWEYFSTNIENLDPEKLFKNFFILGEGRLDNLERVPGIINVLKDLEENEIQIVISGGDGFRTSGHGFKTKKYKKDEKYIKIQKRLITLEDVENLPDKIFDQISQNIPSNFHKSDSETFSVFYHRISQEYFAPFADAAINDPIFAKAFVINPLESKTVINTMRRIPDNLRDGKMVVKRFIRKVKDNIPYDRAVSVQRTHLILDSDSIIKYLIGEINRMLIQSPKVLPNNFISDILKQKKLAMVEGKNTFGVFKNIIRKIAPSKIWEILKSIRVLYHSITNPKSKSMVKIPENIIILRIFIILRMSELLYKDGFDGKNFSLRDKNDSIDTS